MLQTAAAQAELEGLVEASLPNPVAWTPQTPGWYVVFALLTLAAAWAVWRAYRRWQANRYRRFCFGTVAGVLKAGCPAMSAMSEFWRKCRGW